MIGALTTTARAQDAPPPADAGSAEATPVDAGAPEIVPAPPPPPPRPAERVLLRADALPPPPEPTHVPEYDDGPGDQEAKADFQQSRSLPDRSFWLQLGAFEAGVYGFGRLSGLHDSTQSYDVVATNHDLELGPPAMSGQTEGTLTDSRLGLRVGTPRGRPVRALFVAELDPLADRASGVAPTIRHFFLGASVPYFHLLIGRYYDLFGWGGRGFFPNTAAIVAPPSVLYRDRGQIRASMLLRFAPVDFEAALAAVVPVQSDRNAGEAQFGVRLTVNRWRGASAQLAGPPEAAPLQLGISLIGRRFQVNEFTAMPDGQIEGTGRGIALDAFLPLFPSRGSNLGNATSLTVEVTKGSGIADMYPDLTGGAHFPLLPNPTQQMPAIVYVPAIPDGLVTFDRDLNLRSIDWSTLAVGLQYHLPFARGRLVWLSAVYTFRRSDNLQELTPYPSWGSITPRASYYDVNAFVAATRALQIAVSHQVTYQTTGIGTQLSNRREQLSVTYFF